MIKAVGKQIICDLDGQRDTIDIIEGYIENEETWKAMRQTRGFVTILLKVLSELEMCHEVELKG